ncbi:MAG: TerC family protein [Lewinellaceae bacterium]|nr:TerC family protein [Phaeodactylibacter sp.]MCB0615633.1 TerC family protein [Phaeodactylibacter sp.]MCB9351515.1 TerC family protein [Lewinellaceae bacterium]
MEFVFPDFANAGVWMSLLTLTFLEIILGIDNIIFISIASNKLAPKDRPKATNIGLILAMVLRIVLLFGVSVLVAMEEPWLEFHGEFIHGGFSGQSLILIAGGLFLLYKSTTEIRHKLEEEDHHEEEGKRKGMSTLSNVILQITVINIVFSFDSILTAVGMTNGLEGALVIMIIAVVLSVVIMMLFATPVANFVNEHPTIQMLGLAFLILIGFMLIAEGAHLAHLSIAGSEVGSVPKGYLYFAISFSLFVEFLNMRLRANRRKQPVQLHGYAEDAAREGILEKK